MSGLVLPPRCPGCGIIPGSGHPHFPARALAITVAHIMRKHPEEYERWKDRLSGVSASSAWVSEPLSTVPFDETGARERAAEHAFSKGDLDT